LPAYNVKPFMLRCRSIPWGCLSLLAGSLTRSHFTRNPFFGDVGQAHARPTPPKNEFPLEYDFFEVDRRQNWVRGAIFDPHIESGYFPQKIRWPAHMGV